MENAGDLGDVDRLHPLTLSVASAGLTGPSLAGGVGTNWKMRRPTVSAERAFSRAVPRLISVVAPRHISVPVTTTPGEFGRSF